MSAGQTPDNPDNPDGRDAQDASMPWAALWDWLGGRLAVVGRGLLLFWLALAGFVLLVALAAVLAGPPALVVRAVGHIHGRNLALAVAIAGIVAWVVVAPLILLCMRSLARLTRRLAGRWCAVPIADPYLPPPWADGGKRGPRRRYAWLLTDQATWRDLLWVTVDGCVGWILAVLPAVLLVLGVLAVIAPYASLQVRVLAIAGAAFGLWAAPSADARLRLFRPVHARADRAGRTGPAGPSPGPDPHRGPPYRGGRDPPDRAGPARRGAGPAGGHGHDPGRRGADHRHQSRCRAGAAVRGSRLLGQGPGRAARPGPRHPPAGAGRPRPGRRDPGPDPGHPAAHPPGQRPGRPRRPRRSSRPPTSRSANCWPTCPSTPRRARPGSTSGTPTGCCGSG